MVRKNKAVTPDSDSDSDIPEANDNGVETPSGQSGQSGPLQVTSGLAVIVGIIMAPFMVFRKFGWLISLVSVFGLTVATLFVENYCRRNQDYNKSLIRPSVMLTELAYQARTLFNWLGFQFARLTDIFYWIYEYLAEDLFNILKPLGRLLFSWMQFFKGYFDYYLSGLTWVMPGVGAIGSTLVMVLVACVVNYYYCGEFFSTTFIINGKTQFQSLLKYFPEWDAGPKRFD